MSSDIHGQLREKMEASVEALKRELVKIRTGRASLSLLDGIKVNAYGSQMALDQVGTLTIPENNLIAIKPWDPQVLPAIEKAILGSGLGLTPQSDGNVVRLTIPPLTGERRKELVKQVKKIGEEYKVAIRNIRRDAMEAFKKKQKASEITEDDLKVAEKDLQKLTDDMCKEVDALLEKKEKELMAV